MKMEDHQGPTCDEMGCPCQAGLQRSRRTSGHPGRGAQGPRDPQSMGCLGVGAWKLLVTDKS